MQPNLCVPDAFLRDMESEEFDLSTYDLRTVIYAFWLYSTTQCAELKKAAAVVQLKKVKKEENPLEL